MTKKTVPLNVAEYITLQIESSQKLQSEIAKEVGFEKPNVISMIKQGKTKVPLAKIGPLARALGVDPMFLFKMVMKEYLPDTWSAIEAMSSQPILTENEVEIVMALRDAGLTSRKIGASERGPIVRAIKGVVPK